MMDYSFWFRMGRLLLAYAVVKNAVGGFDLMLSPHGATRAIGCILFAAVCEYARMQTPGALR